MAGFVNFPAGLAAILQQGFLEREFEEGLDSVLAYRREALQEGIPVRIGQSLTKTRTGRFTPSDVPINPSTNTGLDNGLTAQTFSIEQYSFTMNEYANAADVQMRQEQAAIANEMYTFSRNLGVQAAQSLERICRRLLFGAYLGGNTYVRTDLGAGGTTTCHVDDIRGFQNVLVNGVVTPVSGTNTLTVQETAVVSGGVTQALTVTGVAADTNSNSQCPGGISGTLTFSAATTPVNGDQLVAANAPKIIRPTNRLTTALLKGSDTLTLGLILDGVSYLRDNAVPPMSDGTYHFILDNTSMRQLFADQDFKLAYMSRYQSDAYRDGEIVSFLGCTYIPTTETYIQQANSMLNGTTGSPPVPVVVASTATSPALVGVRVRRPVLMGAESIIQGNYDGNETWLDREGVNPMHDVYLVNNVAHIIRPPLDRLAQVASLAYDWVGDFAVPTDITATTSVIPTASNALFKRCCVLEHAG